MRLGYPEYSHRLQVIREHSPERYAAIMGKAKTYIDTGWNCRNCSGNERYTRNTACCDCARSRARYAFTLLECHPHLTVYTPPNPEASERYQQRIQRAEYRKYYLRKLSELGEIQCGGWTLNRGVLIQGAERIPFLNPTPEQRHRIQNDPASQAICEHVQSKIGELPG
ncbi:hypothetical protein Q3V30_22610 (plasmid) [Erwinia pyri]|uniref:Uncharacterized protein n=1 Tax=Erwinia pyri TaxID=3062598 RepID=A0AA50DPY8_9GAMM|nr:hypothetical protein [Erwinia sp. DE2]WLS81257.1 hypothetical protein Q3V30_22610 [Erwinia sp. DE2]